MTSSVAAKLAMLNGPAMAPPPGIIPDFVDPPHLGHSFILVLTLGMSFATGAVLLRMLTKFCILHKVVFEDCRLQCLRRFCSADIKQTLSFWDG